MARILLISVLMMCAICLIACSNKEIVKTVYIYPEITIPDEPSYFEVDWQKIDGNYCLDLQNTKNLLKNYETLQTYKSELKQILLNLKKEK